LIICAVEVVYRYCDLDGNREADIVYEMPFNNESGVLRLTAMDRKALDIIRI
jgi:hypothetical protein